MTFQIQKAQRKKAKLRIGVSGPSGSGKTYSALLLARGITSSWDKILLIDTENGSGELYSDLGEYNVITLEAPYTPERYIEAIEAGENAGMEVIIVDSISHEWEGKGGCLEINEKLASAKFKGNTWAAWSETTPRHQRLMSAVTTSRCHIITTARSKTDMMQTEDKKVKKVGMKEIQREGFEYELTANFTIDREGHYAIASKDRTGLFIERDPFVISTETGEELIAWNNGGKVNVGELKKEVIAQFRRLEIQMPEKDDLAGFIKSAIPALTELEWTDENLEEIVSRLGKLTDKEEAQKLAWGEPEKDEEAEIPAEEEVEEEAEEDLSANI